MKPIRLMCVCLWSYMAITCALEYEQVILRAVKGRNAVLRCGQGKVFLDGPESYVLWMKNNHQVLHRYPSDNSRASIQSLEQVFGLQSDEDSMLDPTSLHINRVGEQDAGIYRCRVHYQASPAVDFVIELELVDSPSTPKILNPDGFDLSGNVGLLSLGSNMTLICEVDNTGDSGPLVWWERNGVEVARAGWPQSGVRRTTVQVLNATRDELNAHYVCLAQNADVTDPLTASVVVKMHLPPISVEIRVNNNLDFEAGQPRVVDCVVVGCVPPPTITWHLGDVMLRPTVHKELHDGNFTVSSLTLAPSLRDDKHKLTCRALNSHLAREVFEDSVVINVGFRPHCLNDQEGVIGYVNGQTEGVTCIVEAYPEPVQFSWTFANTKTLYTSVKKVSDYQHRYSSSLTWKPQDSDQGELLCRATNILGEQKRACMYSVIIGGPPLSPDCQLLNKEQETITISCKKSWDGGRPQTIHLELQRDGNTLQNVTDSYGLFSLSQVQGRNLTAVLYASNSRGRSDVNVISLEANSNNKTAVKQRQVMWDQLVQLIIAAISVISILSGVYYCVKHSQKKSSDPGIQSDPEEDRTFPVGATGNFHRPVEFQPVAQEEQQFQHVVRMADPLNYYSPAPSKGACLLGHSSHGHAVPSHTRHQPQRPNGEETTSYCV